MSPVSFFREGEFIENDGVWMQGAAIDTKFESVYLTLRSSEGRVYDDAVVRKLPDFVSDHPLHGEWAMRKKSARRIVSHLKRLKPGTILEIGAGNGWLSAYLSAAVPAHIVGIDINLAELKQAARINRGNASLQFIYGDLFSAKLAAGAFDVIVIAAAAQYFPDLRQLVNRCFELMKSSGELLILDSPFYSEEEVTGAKSRSAEYFTKQQVPEASQFYFHHSRSTLDSFAVSAYYDPQSLANRLRRWVGEDSPFPILSIRRQR